jgi:hypothetical protein
METSSWDINIPPQGDGGCATVSLSLKWRNREMERGFVIMSAIWS